MSGSDFDRKREEGRRIEQAIGRKLRAEGAHLIPTYDYSGIGDNKAPRLEAPPDSPGLVIPDLLVWLRGKQFWLEVKSKARADRYNKGGGILETGFSTRLWHQYIEVQRVTGIPVRVVFVHIEEAEVRGANLDFLARNISHVYDGEKMGRGGMHFFRYDAIPRWCHIDALGLDREGHTPVDAG